MRFDLIANFNMCTYIICFIIGIDNNDYNVITIDNIYN